MSFKEVSNFSILELVDYLLKDFHEPILTDLHNLTNYIKSVGDKPEYNENFFLVKEVFYQLINELKNHLLKEKNVFFPEIIKLEKDKNSVDVLKIENFLRLQKIEHGEISRYLEGGRDLLNKIDIDSDDFVEFKKMGIKLQSIIIDCVTIEEVYLVPKVEKNIKN